MQLRRKKRLCRYSVHRMRRAQEEVRDEEHSVRKGEDRHSVRSRELQAMQVVLMERHRQQEKQLYVLRQLQQKL